MTREILALTVLAGLGAVVLLAAGVRDRLLLAWASLLVGTGIITALLQVAALAGAPQRQWHLVFAALLLVAVTLALALSGTDGGWLRRAPWGWAGVVVGAHGLLAAALHGTRWVRITLDSFEYLIGASLIARTGDHLEIPLRFLLSRGLTLPSVHGLAADQYYLASYAPAIAAATLLALAWAGRELLRGTVPTRAVVAVVAAGLLLLGTNSRFVYNALYVNGHLLFALCALALVTVPLVRMRTTHPDAVGTVVLLGATLATLVPLRPEAFLITGALLAPVVCAAGWPLTERRWTLVAYGIFTALHGAVLASAHLRTGQPVPEEALLALATAALVGGAAWVLPRLPARLIALAPALLTGGLFAVLGVGAALRPALFATSVESIHHNAVLGEGLWGASLVVLGGALVLVVALRRWPEQWPLVLPILSFVAISLVLALGPRGAYRIGPGDSLNRMWLHMVPLAVLALITAAGSRPRTLPRRPHRPGTDHDGEASTTGPVAATATGRARP